MTDNRVSATRDESHDFGRLRQLLKKLKTLFAGSSDSDWEKKTDLPWREWGKYGDKDVSAPG